MEKFVFFALIVFSVIGAYLAFVYWPAKKIQIDNNLESLTGLNGKDFRVQAHRLGLIN
jgi:hypothetical protein